MKVRFNLGRGINYRKWQIKSPIGEKVHHNPWDVQLELQSSVLCNKRKSAQKIFDGGNKTVCSWIDTEKVKIHPRASFDVSKLIELKYNPRESPYWTNDKNENLDGEKYKSLITDGTKIYILK